MDDLISRQAAIDALMVAINDVGILDGDDIRAVFDNLPSAQPNHNAEPGKMVADTISRQAALDAIHCDITVTGRQNAELVAATIGAFADRIKALPTVQPTNEMLERCKFEYIHACKIVSFPTPDVTGKDKQDAYAVIKALQPIFGDVPFAKVERGGKE